MRASSKLLIIVSLAAALAGCGNGGGTAEGTTGTGGSSDSGDKPLVFFSQANSADPWRQVFDAETKAAAEQKKNVFDFQMATAGDDPNKQIDQIETAMVSKPKVLLVSPATVALEKVVADAHKAGTTVILLDRSVPGDQWDCYVGGDNNAIGAAAGQYMADEMHGKGTILMIQGIADAPPTKDRANGFMSIMKKYPGIKVIAGANCDYQRQKAITYMENFLQTGQAFDAVYAHNDEMAIGALLAMKNAHAPKKMIVGIDGCQKEVVDLIKAGDIAATFSYPDPGPKGVEIAADVIAGQAPKSKKYSLSTEKVTKENADAYLTAHPNLAK